MERAARRKLLQVLSREFHAELTAHKALPRPMPRVVAAPAERKAQIAAGLARLGQLSLPYRFKARTETHLPPASLCVPTCLTTQ